MRSFVAVLSIGLLACGPPKSEEGTQGESGSSSGTEGSATIGHSSAPTSGPMDGSAEAGPGDDGPMPTSEPPTATTMPPEPTTTLPPTTTDSVTTGVTSGADEHGVPIFPEETDGSFIIQVFDLPPGDCSPWQENCADGQKCVPSAPVGAATWDSFLCVPLVADPAGPGEPCVVIGHPTSGLDSCGKHAMCWDVDAEHNGTCVPLCFGDTENIEPHCLEEGQACLIANGGALPVCLPACDPLVNDCPGGQVCIPGVAEFACAPDASGPGGGLFTGCAAGNTCDPGLVCAAAGNAAQCDDGSDECCLALCDRGAPACPQGQVCEPWFEAVLEFSAVGFCVDA